MGKLEENKKRILSKLSECKHAPALELGDTLKIPLADVYSALNALKDEEKVIKDETTINGKKALAYIYNPILSGDYYDWSGNLNNLKRLHEKKINCLLIGPKGTGKTQAVYELGKVFDKPIYSINLSLRAREHHIIGRLDTSNGDIVWKKGALPKAMEEGAILYLDEINSVSGSTRLYVKINKKVCYTTIGELFHILKANDSLSCLTLSSYNQKEAKVIWKEAKLLPSIIAKREVMDIELRKGKHIEVTPDYSLFYRYNTGNGYIAKSSPTSEILEESICNTRTLDFGDEGTTSSKIEAHHLILAGLWMGDGSLGYKNDTPRQIIITTGGNADINKFLELSFPSKQTKTFQAWNKMRHCSIQYKKSSCVAISLVKEEGYSPYAVQSARNHILRGTIPKRDAGGFKEDGIGMTMYNPHLISKLQERGFVKYGMGGRNGKGSRKKSFPMSLLVAPKLEIASFLRGWFSADGCLTYLNSKRNPVVYLSHKERENLEYVRTLLLRLGIDSTISQTKQKPNYGGDGIHNSLAISETISFNRFMEWIGFIQPKPDVTLKKRWLPYDVTFDKIRSIKKKSVNQVFDLSVSGTESFIISNGIVCHNCAEPDVLIRLDEALDDRQELNFEGETIHAKDGFWVAASINPLDHPGTKELPPQIISRFGAKLHFDYPNAENEMSIVRKHVTMNKKQELECFRIIELIQFMRGTDLPYKPSLRESIAMSTMFTDGFDMEECLEMALANVYVQWDNEGSIKETVKEMAVSKGMFTPESSKVPKQKVQTLSTPYGKSPMPQFKHTHSSMRAASNPTKRVKSRAKAPQTLKNWNWSVDANNATPLTSSLTPENLKRLLKRLER